MKTNMYFQLVWPLALLATLHIASCNGDSAKSVTAKNDSDTSSDDGSSDDSANDDSANDDSSNDDSATSRNDSANDDSAQEQLRVCPPSADKHAKMATDAAHYIADEGVCEVGYTCVARGVDGKHTVYGCVEKRCGEREVLCGDFCVDAKRDVDFCGAKGLCTDEDPLSAHYRGAVCGKLETCHDGACRCAPEYAMCDGICSDPMTNSRHCGAKGACDNADAASADYAGALCLGTSFCDAGQCRCEPHAITCDGMCVDPSTDLHFCGAVGNCYGTDPYADHYRGEDCGTGRYCKDGRCLCRGNQLWCDAQCINPHTHHKFCGAKGRCIGADPQSDDYKGVDCGEDAVCEDGTCRPLRCQANETLCEGTDAVRRCVDLNTDMAHCGQCGWACADKEYGAALKATECSRGKCLYVCEPAPEKCTNFTFCTAEICRTGSALTTYPGMVCLADVYYTSEYCGACDNACDAACDSGRDRPICQLETCDDDTVCPRNACKNSDYYCGRHCTKCPEIPYAASAHCSIDEGKCIIDACVPGFYPNDDASTCLPLSLSVCATADGAQKADCTSIAHAVSVSCHESGACRVHQCENGYHINGARNACVANAPNACGRIVDYGDKIQDCSQHAAANGAQCLDAGTCQVTKCDQGYHVSADQRYCLANTDRECGAVDSAEVVDCLAKGSMYACVNGACTAP